MPASIQRRGGRTKANAGCSAWPCSSPWQGCPRIWTRSCRPGTRGWRRPQCSSDSQRWQFFLAASHVKMVCKPHRPRMTLYMHFYHKVFKVKVQYLAFINSSLRFSIFPSTGLCKVVHSCSEKLHSSIFHGDNIPATLQEVSVGQFASGSHAKYSEQNNSFFP